MKVAVKTLRRKLAGEVLPTQEHRSQVLSEQMLRSVEGGLKLALVFIGGGGDIGSTPCCCPEVDDCSQE